MPPVVEIRKVSEFAGQEVVIQGWLYNLRESGKIVLPLVRDGTGISQTVVVKSAVSLEVFERARSLTQESSLRVTGKVRADKRAPGGFELDVTDIEIVQLVPVERPYPITPKEHGIEFLMDHRHLWLRSPRQAAILRIRSEIEHAMHDFFYQRGFTRTDPPILTPAACEGTSTLFPVDYFDEQAYLTQSGQLYVEATAAALGKVYTFGPTFRAEKSKTRRHLTEFWMLEPEAAYAHLEDMMELGEGLVAAMVQSAVKNRARELATMGRDVGKLEKMAAPFPRITYDEAVRILQKAGNPTKWGDDFGGDEETLLSKEFEKPVIIHRYPTAMKAFYMATDPARPELSLSFDMIAPEGFGEIIGGGERESSYETLLRRIRESNLPEEAFQWYLDLRRYGSVPHAGFGLGLERTVAWICGTEHIREVIPFPRMLYRVYP